MNYDNIITLPSNTTSISNLKVKEDITLLVLGGSISYGCLSDKVILKPYPTLFSERMKNTYGCNINLYNMSYASYSSLIGMCLTDAFLESYTPDVIVLEYAINNAIDNQSASSYEEIIRRIIKVNPSVAIFSICVVNKDRYTTEDYMREITLYYSGAVISVRSAFINGLDEQMYFDDFCHASQYGHEFFCNCLMYAINSASSINTNIPETLPAYCYDNEFEFSHFYKAKDFLEKTLVDDNKSPLENFATKFKGGVIKKIYKHFNLKYIIYRTNSNIKTAGKCKVYSQNGECIIDSYSALGWTSAQCIEVNITGDYLCIDMSEESSDKEIIIYGFFG